MTAISTLGPPVQFHTFYSSDVLQFKPCMIVPLVASVDRRRRCSGGPLIPVGLALRSPWWRCALLKPGVCWNLSWFEGRLPEQHHESAGPHSARAIGSKVSLPVHHVSCQSRETSCHCGNPSTTSSYGVVKVLASHP